MGLRGTAWIISKQRCTKQSTGVDNEHNPKEWHRTGMLYHGGKTFFLLHKSVDQCGPHLGILEVGKSLGISTAPQTKPAIGWRWQQGIHPADAAKESTCQQSWEHSSSLSGKPPCINGGMLNYTRGYAQGLKGCLKMSWPEATISAGAKKSDQSSKQLIYRDTLKHGSLTQGGQDMVILVSGPHVSGSLPTSSLCVLFHRSCLLSQRWFGKMEGKLAYWFPSTLKAKSSTQHGHVSNDGMWN